MFALAVAVLAASGVTAQSLPFESMAARIAGALQVARGERVLLRVDPGTMGALEPAVRTALEARGAKVETLPYGPVSNFEARLAHTDIYVWLPAPASATPEDQGVRWSGGSTTGRDASCTSTGWTARAMWTGCPRRTRPRTTACTSTRSTSTTASSPRVWIRRSAVARG